MNMLRDQINDPGVGPLVRLVIDTTTVRLDRWPGPHRPGEVIHISGGGLFIFDRVDLAADYDPEVIYTCATRSTPERGDACRR